MQIVGHSLGGGTAAILTYVLREQKELSVTTCVTFAPGWFVAADAIFSSLNNAALICKLKGYFGSILDHFVTNIYLHSDSVENDILFDYAAACMTWELAESGNSFITSIINGADLVPTFSAASVDDLRTEVVILKF